MSRKEIRCRIDNRMLPEADVLLSHGQKVGEISRRLVIPEQTYYHWRRE